MSDFTQHSVIADDGARLGFQQIGSGPGLVLLHGGMMTSRPFSRLASLLAKDYTVYVPDRRGRGMSGGGNDYDMERACADLRTLLEHTGARYVFGLSSGALIALQGARVLPEIEKTILYEPPLEIAGVTDPVSWGPRYEAELGRGKLAEAMVTVLHGTGDEGSFSRLPRLVLVPLMRVALRRQDRQEPDATVRLSTLVPTLRLDIRLVRQMAGSLATFKDVPGEVLLMGGTRSQRFLRIALDQLETTLPRVRRVDLAGLGHTAATDGDHPERVATELRAFLKG